MSNMSFATAINCIDGRTQIPVIEWLKKECGVDYVDMITEPGPNKILAENKDNSVIESIKNRAEISISKHFSKLIAITGHYDCAGNSVERDIQLEQTLFAVKTVESWNFGVLVMGLWVDEDWRVYKVDDTRNLI